MPQTSRNTCTNQTLEKTQLTQDSMWCFLPRIFTLKKVFAWAPKSHGAPANSATHVASWLILGSYLYSVVMSPDVTPFQLVYYRGKDLPDDFQPQDFLGGYILKLLKDVCPFHPEICFQQLDLGLGPRWRDWCCITMDLKKNRCVVWFLEVKNI